MDIRLYVATICLVYIAVIVALDFPRVLPLRGLHDEL